MYLRPLRSASRTVACFLRSSIFLLFPQIVSHLCHIWQFKTNNNKNTFTYVAPFQFHRNHIWEDIVTAIFRFKNGVLENWNTVNIGEMFNDLVIPLLVCPRELRAYAHQKKCTQDFSQKLYHSQTKCPQMGLQINKLWYIYAMNTRQQSKRIMYRYMKWPV